MKLLTANGKKQTGQPYWVTNSVTVIILQSHSEVRHLCGRLSRSRRLVHGTRACLLQPWTLLPSTPLTHLLLLLKLLRLLRSGHLVAQVHEELHAFVMRHGRQVLPLLWCELLNQGFQLSLLGCHLLLLAHLLRLLLLRLLLLLWLLPHCGGRSIRC